AGPPAGDFRRRSRPPVALPGAPPPPSARRDSIVRGPCPTPPVCPPDPRLRRPASGPSRLPARWRTCCGREPRVGSLAPVGTEKRRGYSDRPPRGQEQETKDKNPAAGGRGALFPFSLSCRIVSLSETNRLD